MKSVGIFYGSSTGNTQSAAEIIAKELGVEKSDVFDVGNVDTEKLSGYSVLFFGSSTWGIGELQDDWDGFITKLEKQDLSGKKVAVFGTGDSSSYPDSFCDAIGIIVKAAEKTGAQIIGKGVNAKGYDFDESQAIVDGVFCGLPLDLDNEDDQTESRISQWLEQIKNEAGL
jgi:flavodoxin I